MTTLTVIEKINTSGQEIKFGDQLIIDSKKLVGISTKSLYVRDGHINGTLFLSQRGNGSNGAGDICKIDENSTIEVNSKLFDRIKVYANKANALK